MLQRVDPVAAHAFDRDDLAALVLHRERQTRVDPFPVDQDGARAARALIAALLRPREAEALAERVEPGDTRVETQLVVDPVDVKPTVSVAGTVPPPVTCVVLTRGTPPAPG